MAVVNVTAADPKEGGIFYAGTSTGNVYKTTNEGITWTLVHTIAGAEITALWIDAVYNHDDYPSTAIILVGTSTGRIDRSIDAGGTFAQVTGFSGTGSVKYLVSDPRNYIRWYVGCGSILYVTNDNGASFDTLYDFSDAVIEDAAWSYWTEFLIGLSGTLGANTSAMHSSDDGVTFVTGNGLSSVAEVSAISMSPFEKTEAVALEKDSGRTWKVDSAAGDTYTWAQAGTLIGKGQCMRVDGDMWAIVYAGTNQRLMKTLDLADSWFTIRENIDVRHISLGPLKITQPTQVYFWGKTGTYTVQRFRVMEDNSLSGSPVYTFDYPVVALRSARLNPSICYVVTVASNTIRVHKTTDGGSTWSVVWTRSDAGNLTVKQNALFVSPTDSNRVLLGTTGDETSAYNGVYASSDGSTFTYLSTGRENSWSTDAAWMVSEGIWGVFETSGGIIYTLHDPTTGYHDDNGRYISRSEDAGATFTDLATTGTSWDVIGRAAMTMSRDGQKMKAYRTGAGGGTTHWRSTDSCATFSRTGPDWGNSPATDSDVASISDVNTSNWAAIGGPLYISEDNGENWTTNISAGSMSSVFFDRYDEDTLYVVFYGATGDDNPFIRKSTDLGATWTGLTGGVALTLASISYGRS